MGSDLDILGSDPCVRILFASLPVTHSDQVARGAQHGLFETEAKSLSFFVSIRRAVKAKRRKGGLRDLM